MLNEYFITRIEDLKNKIDRNLCIDPLKLLKGNTNIIENSMDIKPVSEGHVTKKLKELKNKTCHGFDGIPPIILKNCAQVVSVPITWIINTSIIFKSQNFYRIFGLYC